MHYTLQLRTLLVIVLLLFINITMKAQFPNCYTDNDKDGYGDPNNPHAGSIFPCSWYGWVDDNTDCNDNDIAINPGTVWWKDLDNDGITDGVHVQQCAKPTGYKLATQLVASVTIRDCDDLTFYNDYIYAWFPDLDNDGYAGSLTEAGPSQTCQPTFYKNVKQLLSSTVEDCDDSDAKEFPGQHWYPDLDNDGFPGSLTPTDGCNRPANYKLASELITTTVVDCADNNNQSFPQKYWRDADGDNYTSGAFIFSCIQPSGYKLSPLGNDCDDNNNLIHVETFWFADKDGDGQGNFNDNIYSCTRPPGGYFLSAELIGVNDCNDNDSTIHPGAKELCDGKDNDCNGEIDDGFACNKLIYVNRAATGANNGMSWTNAFVSLYDALNALNTLPAGNWQIWVAKGSYAPKPGNQSIVATDRTLSFALRNNVSIYGGFNGDEISLGQRNTYLNTTILTGNIQNDGDNTNNSYNVINNTSINSTALLDGFTITGGNSNTNGGAMMNNAASPTIQNCIFKNNAATNYGGAIYNSTSNPAFTNCLFTGNTATYGGAMYNTTSSPVIVNCTMSGNTSANGSFAWSQTNSLTNISNSILWGNTGSAGLVNTVTSPYTVSYSITQESVTGTGNLNTNPYFMNAADNNFSLASCSPAINAGNNAALPGNVTKDLAAGSRIAFTTIDMGAYERQSAQSAIVYVDSAATGTGDGSSWANACTDLTAALNTIKLCPPVVTVAIAKGTYNAPVGGQHSFDKLNAVIIGGYPHGGIGLRNPAAYPVILKGNVQVLQSLQMEGIRVVGP